METKVPDFVKLKTYNCIAFTDLQHTKLYPLQNLSLGFILKIFLTFRKFQPRYPYKIYILVKEKSVIARFVDRNRLFSHDVTSAILVVRNNKKSANFLLFRTTNMADVTSYENDLFPSWLKTFYSRRERNYVEGHHQWFVLQNVDIGFTFHTSYLFVEGSRQVTESSQFFTNHFKVARLDFLEAIPPKFDH